LAGDFLQTENIYRFVPLSALFSVLGILFPLLFHLIGLGSTFLPMFIPVVMASTLLPVRFAISVAVITPLASFLFTGMPPLYPPILLVVVLELIIISFITSNLYFRLKRSIWVTLFIALVADRVMLFLFITYFAEYFGFPADFYSFAAVLYGIPGIILILIIIPLTLKFLQKKYPQILMSK
jgi:hypothetical protein